MDKLLVLRIRSDDEISDILKLSMANLHCRILRDGVLVDSSEVDGECLIHILESGRKYGESPVCLRKQELSLTGS